MNYLLDTCVISEFRKKSINSGLNKWLEQTDPSRFFLSVVSIGEIQQGISKLLEKQKKQEIQKWLDDVLKDFFLDRILNINEDIMTIWGNFRGEAMKRRKTLPIFDTLIAATADYYHLTVVTRNEKDFCHFNVSIHNPWS